LIYKLCRVLHRGRDSWGFHCGHHHHQLEEVAPESCASVAASAPASTSGTERSYLATTVASIYIQVHKHLLFAIDLLKKMLNHMGFCLQSTSDEVILLVGRDAFDKAQQALGTSSAGGNPIIPVSSFAQRN
jgi:hypothetical protein